MANVRIINNTMNSPFFYIRPRSKPCFRHWALIALLGPLIWLTIFLSACTPKGTDNLENTTPETMSPTETDTVPADGNNPIARDTDGNMYATGTTFSLKTDHEQIAAGMGTIATDNKIVLTFTGDLIAHSINYMMADYSKIYQPIIGYIQADTLTFSNLEAPLAGSYPTSSYPVFNVPKEYAEAAISAGIEVFSIANNHSYDLGPQGLTETLDVLASLSAKYENTFFFSGADLGGRETVLKDSINDANITDPVRPVVGENVTDHERVNDVDKVGRTKQANDTDDVTAPERFNGSDTFTESGQPQNNNDRGFRKKSGLSGSQGNRREFVPVLIETHGISIGFLAVTQFSNRKIDPMTDGVPFLYCVDYHEQDDVDNLLEWISAIEGRFDLFVLSYHGGIEYNETPEPEKGLFFQSLIRAGVDIVYGHHPHIIQPVEIVAYNGRKKIILNSTGNFISGQGRIMDSALPEEAWSQTAEGALFQITYSIGESPTTQDRQLTFAGIEVVPIVNYINPKREVIIYPARAMQNLPIPDQWKSFYKERVHLLLNRPIPVIEYKLGPAVTRSATDK